jgi:hypothetical protein
MPGYYADRQLPNHWSEPRPSSRRRQETPDQRLRSRSISTERTKPPLHHPYRTPTKESQVRDPPSVGRYTLDGGRPYHSDDEANSKNHRRVQFSQRLEVTKTPPASSASILRAMNRSQGVDDRHDPTPRGSPARNVSSRVDQGREPIGATSRLAATDPPVNGPNQPLFSPSIRSYKASGSSVGRSIQPRDESGLPPTPSRASPSRDIRASPLRGKQEGGLPPTPSRNSPYRGSGNGRPPMPMQSSHSPSVQPAYNSPYRNTGVQDRLQSIEQRTTPTSSSPYRDSRNVPSNGRGKSEERRNMFPEQPAVPHTTPTRITSQANVETKENEWHTPLHSTKPKASSSADHWNIKKLFSEEDIRAITPKRNNQSSNHHPNETHPAGAAPESPRYRSAIEILKDLWRTDPNSPESEQSTESQSEYLINKYAQGTKGRVHEIPSLSSPINYRMEERKKPRSYRMRSPGGRRESGNVKRTPRPPPNRIKNDEECPPFFSGDETTKQRGFGRFFKRKKERNILQLAFSHVNTVDSTDDSLEIVKTSTSETDEFEREWNFDRRAAQWNEFDNNSIVSEESDNNYLIPNSEKEKKKNRGRPGLMLCLLLLCLVGAGLPVYVFIFADDSQNQIEMVDKSTCVTSTQKMGSFTLTEQGNYTISAQGNYTFSDRFISIRELVAGSVGNTSMIEVAGSPQRKALCWLSDFDERQLDAEEDNMLALIQRYTMGVLFFSLSDNESEDPRSLKETDFLSPSNECSWGGIMCNDPDAVTALLLGDSVLQGQLPEEIGNLKNLSKLSIVSLRFLAIGTGLLTLYFESTAFLELGLNEINGSIPSTIGMLTMLGKFCTL